MAWFIIKLFGHFLLYFTYLFLPYFIKDVNQYLFPFFTPCPKFDPRKFDLLSEAGYGLMGL
jgi:hypothetical protein